MTMGETWYENGPCNSDECNGLVRRFKIMTATNGSGEVLARVVRCTWCGQEPREVRGSAQRGTAVEINVTGTITPVSAPPQVEGKTKGLEEFGFHVTWYRLDDGLLMVQVHDGAGKLLDFGGGDDPVEMILEVAEHLLPPG
jgi:hypothetical protein